MTATEEALAAMKKAEENWDKMVDEVVEVSGQFQKECQELKVELEEFSDEDFMDDDMPPEPEPSSDNLIYLHIESDQNNYIQYKDLLSYFDNNDINLADEGGWLKIYLDDSNNFSLVNGLKPGRFLPEEGIDSTSIITMILITDEQNNCVEAFQGMAEMSYKLAAYLSANVLDSDRNKLTKQMYDHYMQQAEETDLKKLSYPDGFQGGNSKKYTDLKNRILELNESYHRHDISEVSDEKYDSLFKELIDFEKNNDFLVP